MPKVGVEGIQINYELHGSGDPVVLIGGLGADMFLWFRQVPELSQHFQVIAFDNRGAGESDKPDEPYSISQFAADTAGLMKVLGITRAHIIGASLGGLIAQELALTYPEMIHRLVLVSTTFGGPHSARASFLSIIKMIMVMRRTGNPEADVRRSFSLFTSKQWREEHADLIDQYVSWRVLHPQPPYAHKRQRQSISGFNAESRVAKISSPTMIVHGGKDLIVPVRNAHLLADRIPNSEIVLFEDAGHACIIDHAEQFNSAVIQFMKSADQG